MKVVSWNILCNSFIGGPEYRHVDPASLEHGRRWPIIVKALQETHADAILLQEVCPEFLTWAEPFFRDYINLVAWHDSTPMYGNAILLKPTFSRVQHRMMPCESGHIIQRVFASYNGQPLQLINVHLHWSSESKREVELQIISSLTNRYANPIVCGGDFNSDRSEHDIFRLTGGWKSLVVGPGTYLCETPQIDWLYGRRVNVRSSGMHNDPLFQKNCHQRTVDQGSDHVLVWADVELD